MAMLMATTIFHPSVTMSADRTEVALSTLEFGGSLSKLLWVSVQDERRINAAQADQFSKLA
jgi:hypothetical protein